MHILLIHQAFAALDEPGGTRHHEFARQLARRGHRVTVIASPVSYLTGKQQGKAHWVTREVDDLGVTILRTYTYRALHRSFLHRIISFFSFMASAFLNGLSVKQVDLVWGTSPPIFQGASAWLLARLKGIPFLFEVRDLWPAFAIAVGVLKNRTIIRLSEWLERFLYRHADHVMVNSPGFIAHVQARGAKAITLIPNGADPQMFNPQTDGNALRLQHGLADKFVVLYAGAHGMSNDLAVVLQAAELLKNEAHIHFVFLGDGKEKASLEADAVEKKLDNVLFLPSVAKKEMGVALAMADACLAILKPIDLYKTTYPNKVFDYMTAGKPVLLAIDGVIREVVENAQAGVFIQPGNAQNMAEVIRQMAANPEKCLQMGINGRQYIEEHFNRQKLTEQLADLFEDVRRKNG